MQLAGNRLQQIARRQQALHHAVFIDHKNQAAGLLAELLEQLHAAERLRYKYSRTDVRGHGRVGLVAQIQQPCDADDPHDLIERAPANRVMRMAAATALGTGLRQAIAHVAFRVEPSHIGARRHQRGQRPLVEAEHVLHHLVLVLLNDSGIHTFLKTRTDLFFGDMARGVHIDTQHPQGVGGGARQQFDKGLGRCGQP